MDRRFILLIALAIVLALATGYLAWARYTAPRPAPSPDDGKSAEQLMREQYAPFVVTGFYRAPGSKLMEIDIVNNGTLPIDVSAISLGGVVDAKTNATDKGQLAFSGKPSHFEPGIEKTGLIPLAKACAKGDEYHLILTLRFNDSQGTRTVPTDAHPIVLSGYCGGGQAPKN